MPVVPPSSTPSSNAPRNTVLTPTAMRNDIIVTTKLNVIISSLVTLTWLLAFGLLFRNAVVPVLALVIVASTLAIRRLYLLHHLSDNECYWLLLAMTWVLLWIMVGVTGGARSPLLTTFLTVVSISLTTAPQAEHSIVPILLMLTTGFVSFSLFEVIGNPLPQYPIAFPVQANLFCMLSVCITALIRGSTFRRLLREALLKEQSAHDAKSRLVANVSHELRTPLTTIIGWTELLLRGELPLETRRPLEVIGKSSGTLLSIINDLLDYSKMENHKLTLEALPFDIREFASNVAEATRVLFKPGVAFQVAIVLPNVQRVIGDAHRLAQCANNVLSNAAKFTHHGEVTFSVTEGPRTERGVTVIFEVRDTGIGMRPETLERLFKPFAQADPSTARKFGGTGLGMNITQQIVVTMGGTMHVESELDKGSTFRWEVVFPVVGDDAPEVTSLNTANSDDVALRSGLRVLVVEDNELNRQLISRYLDMLACEAREACNGREAVQIMSRETFDIVLMDIKMPEMDGIEATRTLRVNGDNTLIVGLTANPDEANSAEAHGAGMDGMLGKPIRFNELKAALHRYTSSQSHERA